MKKGKYDHSLSYKRSEISVMLLVVYVDDIVVIGSDIECIAVLKSFLHTQFMTKNLGVLKHLLGIEVTRN